LRQVHAEPLLVEGCLNGSGYFNNFIQNLQTAVVAAAEAIDLYQPISRISVFINHSWVKA